jgi:hypothetical protein
MDSRDIGLTLIVAGVIAILVGAAVFTGLLGWFGRLPGDIRIEGERTRVYIPLASMLLLSVLLSLALYLWRRFF